MKFAVTGGAGFVGNNIVRLLVSEGHEVLVIDNLHTGKKENLEGVLEKIQFHNIDIRDYEKLENILKNVDGVFHEAALTIVQESFTKQDEYFDVNVYGTENILKIAKKFGIKIVYASSSSIYGNSEKIPITEELLRKPINPYGETKLQDEILAEKYSKDGTKVIGLRYFNIFGKGQTGSYAGVITQFLRKISKKEELRIFGDGNQVRDFIHVTDIAKANLIAMQSEIEFGFFNIGTGKPTTINDLANIMIELSGEKLNVKHQEPLDGDVRMSLADTQKTEKMLHWKYEIELKNGLKELIRVKEI
jgi:UDP-glucose 4-epimerase